MIYIFFLKKEGEKPEDPDSIRMSAERFIHEVAQYSKINDVEAERMINFVFGYFPGFDWRRNLPTPKSRRTYLSHDRAARGSDPNQ